MIKLIEKYLANPTYKNAQKVRAYERAHPMARCMLTAEYTDALANAIRHANVGHD
jgi:hypothetical protein